MFLFCSDLIHSFGSPRLDLRSWDSWRSSVYLCSSNSQQSSEKNTTERQRRQSESLFSLLIASGRYQMGQSYPQKMNIVALYKLGQISSDTHFDVSPESQRRQHTTTW